MKQILAFLVLLFAPLYAIAQPINAQITPTATTAHVRWSIAGLPYYTDCTITWFTSGDVEIANTVISEGLTTREYVITGLTASTSYKIDINCGLPFEVVNRDSFVTAITPAVGNVDVSVSIGQSAHPSAARAQVKFGQTEAVDCCTVENSSCDAGCTITLAVPRGQNYYKTCWKTSGDVEIACGAVSPLIIGNYDTKQLTSSVNGGAPAVPFFAQWEARMIDAGLYVGDKITNVYNDPPPSSDYSTRHCCWCYYDSHQVFRSIAAYTGNEEPWMSYADICKDTQEFYMLNAAPHPTWTFVGGARMAYWDFMDDPAKVDEWTTSRDSIIQAANVMAYCGDVDYDNPIGGAFKMREAARCLLQIIEAARIGYWREYRQKRDFKYQQALNIFSQEIFGPRTYRVPPSIVDFYPVCPDMHYYQPFMVAIMVYGFVNDMELNPDDTALAAELMPKLEEAGDVTWANAWNDNFKYLFYQHCQPDPFTPNNPWKPMMGNSTSGSAWYSSNKDVAYFMFWVYAWLYDRTGATKWRDHAYDIMEKGVEASIYYTGKQYNETYIWSFEAMCYLDSPTWKLKLENGDQVLLEDGGHLERQCRL